jgi:hypothetical protein
LSSSTGWPAKTNAPPPAPGLLVPARLPVTVTLVSVAAAEVQRPPPSPRAVFPDSVLLPHVSADRA